MISYETFATALETYLTNLCYRKDEYIYNIYFTLGSFEMFCIERRKDNHNIWYRETNYSKWYKINLFTPLNVSFLKEIASKLVKAEKQNNIKQAIEELEKDFK